MLHKGLSILAAGAALASLAACGGPRTRVVSGDRPVRLSRSDLPRDARAAIAAAVATMRLDAPSAHPHVRFEPGEAERLREAFTYDGFELLMVSIAHYDVARGGGAVDLDAVLAFVDPVKRRALTGISLRYGAEGGDIVIRRARAVEVPPEHPDTRMFVLPAARMPRMLPTSHAGLLDFAMRNALNGAQRRRAMDGATDLVLCAVAHDRLPRNAQLRLGVAGGPTASAFTAGARDVNYLGFHAALMPVRLRVEGPQRHFATVDYVSGRGQFGGTTRRVGAFDLADTRASPARVLRNRRG